MQIEAPLRLHSATVLPEWIDHNGHMNVAYYVLAFDHATDAFFQFLGIDDDYRARTGGTTFALECHVAYLRELRAGDPMRFETQLLDCNRRHMHFFHTMYHGDEGYLAATAEWINTHVDLTTRRSADFHEPIYANLQAVMAEHGKLPRPEQAGRVIGIRRKG
jgi:acyl-CoA thioester hydrolase